MAELETMDWAEELDEGKTYTCNIDNADDCEACGS